MATQTTLQTKEGGFGYRWVILGVLWFAYTVTYLTRLSAGPLGPFMKNDYGIGSAEFGMITSAASIGFAITIFLGGWLADKVGARLPIVIGEFIAGIATVSIFFTTSYFWLLALMFLAGLGCGLLMAATTQGVIIWFPYRERATAMGLKQTAVNIGGMTCAALLPLIAVAMGWRFAFLVIGFITVSTGIMALVLYKKPPRQVVADVHPGKTGSVRFLDLLKNRDVWLISLAGVCFSWVEISVIAHLVLYLTEGLLVSAVAAGGVLAVTQIGGGIARPIYGLMSDRTFHGRRKPVLILMACVVFSTSLLLGLIGPALGGATYPIIFILGLGGLAWGGVGITLMSELGGREGAGKVVGFGSTVVMIGTITAPIVFGWLVDVSGGYNRAWLSVAGAAALCTVLLLLIRESRKKL